MVCFCKTLYLPKGNSQGKHCLFVVQIDLEHFVETVQFNFPVDTKLVVAGTIQFSTSVQAAKERLRDTYPSLLVPQCRPLSPGRLRGPRYISISHAGDQVMSWQGSSGYLNTKCRSLIWSKDKTPMPQCRPLSLQAGCVVQAISHACDEFMSLQWSSGCLEAKCNSPIWSKQLEKRLRDTYASVLLPQRVALSASLAGLKPQKMMTFGSEL